MFFGRERLVAELVARLVGAPLLAWSARPAAASPRRCAPGCCRRCAAACCPGCERWPRALMRPGEHPLPRSSARLPSAGGEPLVLAVDQFEELVHRLPRRARADGVPRRAGRARARDPRPTRAGGRRRARRLLRPLRRHPELSRLLGANQVLVGPMRRDELRRAIELPGAPGGPARRARAHRRADRRRRSTSPAALPLLSAALLELWQRARRPRLRLRAYERAGGVRGAVGRLAERAYERLTPSPSATSRGGSCCGWPTRRRRRRRAPPGAARRARAGASVGAEALAVLADSRLVTDRRGRRSRSRTRRCCASGRACAPGSRRTPRAAACTST